MAILRCQAGAALVTALMLTMLCLVIAMALLYTVTTGTRISASQKRYRSALQAAHGGVELMTLEIIPRLAQLEATESTLKSDFSLIDLQLPHYDCLQQKLAKPTSQWGDCNASYDTEDSPDLVFKLSGEKIGEKGFNVSAKIVDTVPGNSDKNSSELLDQGSAVAGIDEVIIRPQHVPAIYSVSVQGVREGGHVREKAKLSALYAY